MADNPALVALLKEMAAEASITRPEVGVLVGKTVGQMAGIHNRNVKTIGTWPTINAERRKNRRCQFPLGMPGTNDFHLCGCERARDDSLRCKTHKGKTWTPPSHT